MTDTAAAPSEGAPSAPKADHATSKLESVRVQSHRLDELMDQLGELVIAQARPQRISDDSGNATLSGVAEEIERLVTGLRDATLSIRMLPIELVRQVPQGRARSLGRAWQEHQARDPRRRDRGRQERHRQPDRAARPHHPQLHRPRRRDARGAARGRQARAGARADAGAPVRRRGADLGRRRRRRPRRGRDPRPRPGARADRRGPGDDRRAALPADLRARLLDRQEALERLGPRRRHGCGVPGHRRPARYRRGQVAPGTGDAGHAAPAADARDHGQAAGPRRGRAVRAAALQRRGMRRAARRGDRPRERTRDPAHPRRAGAVPQPRYPLRLRARPGHRPAGGHHHRRRTAHGPRRRRGRGPAPDRDQAAQRLSPRHRGPRRLDHPRRRLGGADPRRRRAREAGAGRAQVAA